MGWKSVCVCVRERVRERRGGSTPLEHLIPVGALSAASRLLETWLLRHCFNWDRPGLALETAEANQDVMYESARLPFIWFVHVCVQTNTQISSGSPLSCTLLSSW